MRIESIDNQFPRVEWNPAFYNLDQQPTAGFCSFSSVWWSTREANKIILLSEHVNRNDNDTMFPSRVIRKRDKEGLNVAAYDSFFFKLRRIPQILKQSSKITSCNATRGIIFSRDFLRKCSSLNIFSQIITLYNTLAAFKCTTKNIFENRIKIINIYRSRSTKGSI